MAMNDTQSSNDEASKPAAAKRPRPVAGPLAALIAIAAIAVSGFALYLVQHLGDRLEEQRQAFNELGGTATSDRSRLARLETDSRAMNKRLDELVRKQAQEEERLNRLLSASRNSSGDWALSEVEYLLVIATHRLVLAHDPQTALSAMQAADARLRDLNLPGITEVRSQITSDMDALKAVPEVDITGLTLFLSDLAQRARKLPVNPQVLVTRRAPQAKSQPAQVHGWRSMLEEMWRSLKGLVVVTRRTSGIRLLPEEKYFVVQNLQLQIEAARLAVLERNTEGLHASVHSLLHWLHTYYDQSDEGVASVLQSVQQMGKVDLQPKLPDISSSLETLRAYMHQRADDASQGDTAPPAP